ncbi:glycoside hydrolase family 3 C-terminal domain-containing protein [Salinactinospora qingdaonensis]|uniref:Glycoside hydrolase family 3 C-terminal domain-containing protein n=1 Tax=Salinactinospora qingdaonensis TaxID=702744 RepID=A0ABP7G6U8_9ACTN
MTDDSAAFRDSRLSFDERVDDLLERLTTSEKIALLHQFTPAFPHLGISAFRTGQEALHGVAWMGPATVFPQAVGLGATWHPELLREVGTAVGTEVRAMRARDSRVGLNVWSPTVNLLRDPRWGRNEEGYAEDPRLTAALATAYSGGLRGDHPVYWRTAPLLKHWLAHNNETDRSVTSSSVRARVLHEYELPAFRGPVVAGTVIGVMPAYNLVNGRPNHVGSHLRDHLRAWTDAELVVCSDAAAPSNLVDEEHYFDTHEESHAAALRAGVDSFTDHDQDSSKTIARLTTALEAGLIETADIDRAARRLLLMRLRLGEFDPDVDPYAGIGVDQIDTPHHQALAQRAAEEAVVLLKNDAALPLDSGRMRRLAVVGPLADEVKLDWYSGDLIRRCSPLEGLRERLGAGTVVHAEGADRILLQAVDGGRWLTVAPETPDRSGEDSAALNPAHVSGTTELPPVTLSDVPSELDLLDWGGGVVTLRAVANRHYLSVGDDDLLRADKEQPGGWVVQETFHLEPVSTEGGNSGAHRLFHLGSGRYVSADPATGALRVFSRDAETAEHFMVLPVSEGASAVADAARDADAVLVVVGNDPHINGRETEDRADVELPAQQRRLVEAARAANPRTILAMTSSYPYAVPDLHEELPALLWSAHGGQAAGHALARVLLGEVSPAGRLPQTWYRSTGDLPDLLDYDIIGAGATYQYFTGPVLYPFGHGLSYTSFGYTDLRVERSETTVTAEFTVTNTGERPGDEVAQLYIRALDPRVPRPRRELRGHWRGHLRPGESQRVSLAFPVTELGHWDVAHGRWTVDPGSYEILVGRSSEAIELRSVVTVTGAAPQPRPALSDGIEACAFDECDGIVLADRDKQRGDVVACDGEHPGRLLFRDCDLTPAPRTVTFEVARESAGAASVELRSGETPIATATVPSTGDRYTWTRVSVPVAIPAGTHDLRLILCGSLRLNRVDFSATG